MNSTDRVQKHFDKDAVRFDAIYEAAKPTHQRLVDHFFRRVVVERFRLVCNLAPHGDRWSVLDVGCGSGRYGLALAGQGASRAVGVDFSERMIELAREAARKLGLAERCQFEVGEFLAQSLDGPFDLVLGMGYFDYLRDPQPHLRKMVDLCQGTLVASFPKRWEWRAPSRKLRFLLQNAFVRLYSRGDVERLVGEVGLPAERASILSYDRDWILIARVGGAR